MKELEAIQVQGLLFEQGQTLGKSSRKHLVRGGVGANSGRCCTWISASLCILFITPVFASDTSARAAAASTNSGEFPVVESLVMIKYNLLLAKMGFKLGQRLPRALGFYKDTSRQPRGRGQHDLATLEGGSRVSSEWLI